jgi:hypothetical protein
MLFPAILLMRVWSVLCLPIVINHSFPTLLLSRRSKRKILSSELLAMLHYLRDSTPLPADEKTAELLLRVGSTTSMVYFHFENSSFPNRCCIVVPQQLRPEVLQEAHAGCFVAHFAEKAYDRLRRSVWWKGMKADVCRHC